MPGFTLEKSQFSRWGWGEATNLYFKKPSPMIPMHSHKKKYIYIIDLKLDTLTF